jgi:hypothetical protein
MIAAAAVLAAAIFLKIQLFQKNTINYVGMQRGLPLSGRQPRVIMYGPRDRVPPVDL